MFVPVATTANKLQMQVRALGTYDKVFRTGKFRIQVSVVDTNAEKLSYVYYCQLSLAGINIVQCPTQIKLKHRLAMFKPGNEHEILASSPQAARQILLVHKTCFESLNSEISHILP